MMMIALVAAAAVYAGYLATGGSAVVARLDRPEGAVAGRKS
jgi:hypothetical protein